MKKGDPRDIMPDGLEDDRRRTATALWRCLAVLISLLALTVVSYVRPDWIQTVLVGATIVAFVLTGIDVGKWVVNGRSPKA